MYILWFLTSSIFHLKFQPVCLANLLPAKRASKRSSVFSRCRVAASSCQECTCHSQRFVAPGIGFHVQRIQPPNEVDGFHAKESPVSKESSPPFWLSDSKIKKFVLHWHFERKVNTNFPVKNETSISTVETPKASGVTLELGSCLNGISCPSSFKVLVEVGTSRKPTPCTKCFVLTTLRLFLPR